MQKNNSLAKIILSFSLITCFAQAQNELSLTEKIASIKKSLYKTSPSELCTILNVPYEKVPVIQAHELKEEIENQNNVLVVNVLPAHYHNDCHIQGSINAPLPELVTLADSWNRSQKIVVYCALDECDAGEKGCILLAYMGFTNVFDYKGGIKEWYQLEYPIQGPALSEYLHTKGLSADECSLYPEMLVCSRQTRWINRYQE